MIDIIFATLNLFDYQKLSTPPAAWVSQSHYGTLSIKKQTLTIYHTDTQQVEVFTFEELCAMDILGADEEAIIDIRGVGGAIFINSHIVVVDYDTCETGREKSRQPYAIFNGKYKVESYNHVPTVRETMELFMRKYGGMMYFINSTDFITLDYQHGGIIQRGEEIFIGIVSGAPRFVYDNIELYSAKGNPVTLITSEDLHKQPYKLMQKLYKVVAEKDDVLYLVNTDIQHSEFRLATLNLTTIN
jgi:hypothetical protein